MCSWWKLDVLYWATAHIFRPANWDGSRTICTYIAIEHGPVERVVFPTEKWWFSIVMSIYQRVTTHQIPFNHHFPMVFPWFFYGFPMIWSGLPITWPPLRTTLGLEAVYRWSHGRCAGPMEPQFRRPWFLSSQMTELMGQHLFIEQHQPPTPYTYIV